MSLPETLKAINDSLIQGPGIFLTEYLLQEEYGKYQQVRGKKSMFQLLDELELKYGSNPKYSKASYNSVKVNQEDDFAKWSLSCSKEVYQYPLDSNELIAKYSSIYQCAKAIGFPKGFSNISRALNGKTKNNAAYKFRFFFNKL